MYTALYRACRPEVFDEILGQEHIVRILKNQIASDTVSHAYLFCGTRGTGKTTTARILAKAVNCTSDGERPCGSCASCRAISSGSFMDVIEIDAASNNGVDNVRELRESVKYPPSAGKKKVYIIDEVHMLSSGAFNALLKTLEEPPEHVMFILATTEPQKIPATILSRCMRLDFRRVPQRTLADNMIAVCGDRGVTLNDDAAMLLAGCADGSVRDGLSVLDQVLAGGDKVIDRDKVLEYVGTTGEEFFTELTDKVSRGSASEALLLLNEAVRDGKDVRQIMKDWVSHYRNLLIAKFVKDPQDMLNMSVENIKKLTEQSRTVAFEDIDRAVTLLSRTVNDARWSANPRVLLELAIVSIASGAGGQTAPTQQPQTAAAPARQPQTAAAPPRPASQQAQQPATPASQPAAPQPSAPARPTEAPAPEASATPARPTAAQETPANVAPPPEAPATHAAEQSAPSAHKSEEAPAQQAPAAAAPQNDENEALWQSICDGGAGVNMSFNLIKGGTRLLSIEDESFTVMANSAFTKRYVEQKKEELEKLMAERTGRRRKLVCLSEDEKPAEEPRDKKTEDFVREAESLLGISIEIE